MRSPWRNSSSPGADDLRRWGSGCPEVARLVVGSERTLPLSSTLPGAVLDRGGDDVEIFLLAAGELSESDCGGSASMGAMSPKASRGGVCAKGRAGV